ncbi:DUF3471 domain-containing protein [Adhaeribacter swui]|uniref:DUF3471 domain-containing protein n=1 Tax=Adhaeribacter swui TaxID=2086471 RepID=A0A7G7G3K7_9BACT|nr:DUF3471 domain-containing protein [Adhaeribacter swui]QNF31741.1 DUF3471 domain-containing protein [Adhaeribacter swui]
MNQSYVSVGELKDKPNQASPHGFNANQQPVPTTFTPWDAWNPAAGIFTSVSQHAQWIRLQLNRGTYKGKRIFSEAVSRDMWAPVQPIPISKEAEVISPSTHFSATGLGWFLTDYQGRKIVAHGGGHEGMNSRVVLVPEENLSMVILTNSMSSIMTPLANQTLDAFLKTPDSRDWSQFYLAAKNKAAPVNQNTKNKTEVPAKNQLPISLAAYTGTYNSPLYGDATVTLTNNKLQLQLVAAPTLNGSLSPWQTHIFDLDWKTDYALLTPTRVRFLPGPDGSITDMRLDANNPDFIFAELEFKKVK